MIRTIVFILAVFILPLSSCSQNKGTENLDAIVFKEKLAAQQEVQLIDVRTPEEFASGHLEGARNININDPDFAVKIATLDTGKQVFVYCKSGGRSARAADEFRQAGFKEVYNLKGGIVAWKNKGLSVTE